MPQIVIVSWRDIPAQVIVREGRATAKRHLGERFEQAIDRCAMKVGARDDDAYLAAWRKSAPVEAAGALEALAEAEAERLRAAYDAAALRALVEADGWAAG